jgi:hypothetical protein
VLFHDRESRGALAYLALAGEMIRREEEEREKAAGLSTEADADASSEPSPADAVSHNAVSPEVGTNESNTESITSEGSEAATSVPDPHTAHTDN